MRVWGMRGVVFPSSVGCADSFPHGGSLYGAAVGFCSLLRFPHHASGLGRPLRSATAAPKNPPCFRRRRRSDF